MWKLIKIVLFCSFFSSASASFQDELKHFMSTFSEKPTKNGLQEFHLKLKEINSSNDYSIDSITLEKALEDLTYIDASNKIACEVYQNNLFVSFGVRKNKINDLPGMVRLAHKISEKLCEKAK
ncbi:hypothetical protein [Bacteriovorax sp. Seq25_V]|uniref:hypothetical protein n=1 Tax=Bacteriovorax sp. Seq25_V TaxID=1201288 RepID=UPI00038A0DF0|nr:hypothetical protein [Bacteriovorax sp. Seq25_V]EQC46105.1 hypothetical protein M900_1694 [Bacteriovorax sp. Seq25_V]